MKKVAIIGTGIAGMGCASQLNGKFDLTLYEKNDYVGGHTNTVIVDEDGTEIPIDTGFMVYNETTYPNLTRLFADLKVQTKPASMSFSVQHIESGLEFAGTGFSGLFAQIKNILSPKYFRFLKEISRFNASCGEVLKESVFQKMTLLEYCDHRYYSEDFRQKYLVPMSAAVWSSPPGKMLEFPAITLVRFFTNHRFLSLTGQLQWRTVVGGSHMYRDTLVRPFVDRIAVKNAAKRVRFDTQGASVEDARGLIKQYDAVVIASHADEALSLIENPSALQVEILSKFKYQKNRATLHTDEAVMPKARNAWTSWNYRMDREGPSTIYWMNSLQQVSKKRNYFVSINDPGKVAPAKILKVIDYEHPLYSLDAISAQTHLTKLNQDGRVFFCGSYFNYGFHEDALTAGLQAAEALITAFNQKDGSR